MGFFQKKRKKKNFKMVIAVATKWAIVDKYHSYCNQKTGVIKHSGT